MFFTVHVLDYIVTMRWTNIIVCSLLLRHNADDIVLVWEHLCRVHLQNKVCFCSQTGETTFKTV